MNMKATLQYYTIMKTSSAKQFSRTSKIMQVISDVLHSPEVHVPSSEDECYYECLTQIKVLPESKINTYLIC